MRDRKKKKLLKSHF